MCAKIIRFYANIQPSATMDLLTIEDLRAAGFGPVRYRGRKDALGYFEVLTNDKVLVHESVPVFASQLLDSREHPLVSYSLGSGWGAQWGAMYFYLRNEVELWRFMKFFDYPLPIDNKTN